MNILQYIDNESIFEIKSVAFDKSLRELLELGSFKGNIEEIIEEIIAKEDGLVYTGDDMAVVCVHSNLSIPCEVYVGYSEEKIKCPNGKQLKPVKTLFLVVLARHERNFMTPLVDFINVLQNSLVVSKWMQCKNIAQFKTVLLELVKRQNRMVDMRKIDPNEIFLQEASNIAKTAKCSSIMLFGEVLLDDIDISGIMDGLKVIRTVKGKVPDPIVSPSVIDLNIAESSTNWLHRFRGAILLGITKDLIKCDEKVCCVGCTYSQDIFDTVFVFDVSKEFRPFFTSSSRFLQNDIKPEVLERTLTIASEIAIEGREGKPVGCLFVIGDINKISLFMKPLVLNPFYGYPESERNILNQFMEETIKEFSLIDGAFVIRGDGIIESAGTLIYTPNHNIVMPSGFGTRHAAAASISWAAECIAIAISESTRSVTLFQNGQMLQLLQK